MEKIMNYQKLPPQDVIDIFKAANVEYFYFDYYAYPQTFGSTSGPRGVIGGCAMSKFTVEAWVCNGCGPTVYQCAGMFYFDPSIYHESRFEYLKHIKHWMSKLNVFGEKDDTNM